MIIDYKLTCFSLSNEINYFLYFSDFSFLGNLQGDTNVYIFYTAHMHIIFHFRSPCTVLYCTNWQIMSSRSNLLISKGSGTETSFND